MRRRGREEGQGGMRNEGGRNGGKGKGRRAL